MSFKNTRTHAKPRVATGAELISPITFAPSLQTILELGAANRVVAETKMNATSSRSHLVFVVRVIGVNRITGATSEGKLTLVDLAGSERVSKTKATGQRLIEAASINKSLVSLGMVFQALGGKQKHIPYRNSMLTTVGTVPGLARR